MTKPTCGCWKFNDDLGWYHCGDDTDEFWENNWPFCHWCGQKAEEA